MEHLYTVLTKSIEGKIYYFVKKILVLSDFKDLADIVVGYGMHTNFEKACSIAGVPNTTVMQQLLLELELRELPTGQINGSKKTGNPRSIQIPESVNRWLQERGTEMLN